jgi:YVTN family beta-propeller protein
VAAQAVADQGKLFVVHRWSNDVDVLLPGFGYLEHRRKIRVGKAPQILGIWDGRLYVADYHSNTVTVIHTDTLEVIAVITVGQGPFQAAKVPQFLYVANHSSKDVTVIDTHTHQVVRTIENISPRWIAAQDPYVWVQRLDFLDVIDSRTNAVVKSIPIGFPEHEPFMGNHLYVENANTRGLAVLDMTGETTIPMKKGLRVLAECPELNLLYVATGNSTDILVVDTVLNKVVGRIGLNAYVTFAHAEGPYILVAHRYSRYVLIIDARTNQVVGPVRLDGPAVAMGRLVQGQEVFITTTAGGILSLRLDDQLLERLARQAAPNKDRETHSETDSESNNKTDTGREALSAIAAWWLTPSVE